VISHRGLRDLPRVLPVTPTECSLGARRVIYLRLVTEICAGKFSDANDRQSEGRKSGHPTLGQSSN